MKKHYKILLILLILVSTTLCGCTTNNSDNLAKDLDSTVKNLMVSVSKLDWPEDGLLENFNNIKHTSNTTQTEDNIIVDTQIDTSEIYVWLENIHSKINILLSKRGDLLLYLNEIYSGNVSFTEDDLFSINVYMNILKDNSNYLSNYNGQLKNQINEAKEIYDGNSNTNLINAYLIKAVETLQLRCAKIDTSILSMTSIIDIVKNNLINNYFDYNKHETSTIDDNTTPTPQQKESNITDEQKIEQPKEEIVTEPIETPQQNDDIVRQPTPNEENAINFDGEVTPVETSDIPIPEETLQEKIDSPNYDHLIKTLEEPIIDDVEESAINNEKSPSNAQHTSADTNEGDASNDKVTREVIHDKNV